METLIQIVAFGLMLVALASGVFLLAVQPIWGIIDAAVSPRLSNGAKVAIILLTLVLLGPVMTIIYALTRSGAIRRATIVAGAVFLASVSGVLTLAALSPHDTDLGGAPQAAVDDADTFPGVTDPNPPASANPYPDPAPPAASAP